MKVKLCKANESLSYLTKARKVYLRLAKFRKAMLSYVLALLGLAKGSYDKQH